MDKLHTMKAMLVEATYDQLKDLEHANYQEVGAAIDMIKDLAKAIYYCSKCEDCCDDTNEEEPEQSKMDLILAKLSPEERELVEKKLTIE